MRKEILGTIVLLPLAATLIQHPSPNFLERFDVDSGQEVTPTILVLHYTAQPLWRVQEIFAKTDVPTPVSAHYTIDADGHVYQHVLEEKAARHAGVSYWQGLEGPDATQKKINFHSIGIEHVNLGYRVNSRQPQGIVVKGSDKEWYPYDARQIEATIALCKKILQRNKKILPRNVVAHSDIAPRRKNDPGPLFPWKKLAEHGIGVWPDSSKLYPLRCLSRTVFNDEAKRTEWLIKHLHIWGYRLPDADVTQEDIIRAFQMHYRPTLIDGKADKETVARLQALLCEHCLINKKCSCLLTA